MIYLIHNTNNNTLKIGKSDNPEKRLKQLLTATSDNLVLVKTLPGENDTKFKKIYKEYHINREWYKYSEYIINDIDNRPDYLEEKEKGYQTFKIVYDIENNGIEIDFVLYDEKYFGDLILELKKEFRKMKHPLEISTETKLKLNNRYSLQSFLRATEISMTYDCNLVLHLNSNRSY